MNILGRPMVRTLAIFRLRRAGQRIFEGEAQKKNWSLRGRQPAEL